MFVNDSENRINYIRIINTMIDSPVKHKFSLQDVILMEESGILGPEEHVELLEGELIDMSPIHPPHAICMNNLTRYFVKNTHENEWIVSVQNPVYISDLTVLEPDLVVARYAEELLADRYITPSDIKLLIEVSDATYPFDKGRKLEIYAESGITEYWIVNLREKRLEVHKSPRSTTYTSIETFTGSLSTPFGPSLNVQDILPKG